MGNAQKNGASKVQFEMPSENHVATLYYFAGRGLADQIRWMLAASNVSFCQKVIHTREKMLKMTERQLPFGQIPMLQIDGLEIVQSQAVIRYLAKRDQLIGVNAEEEVKCDMIVEAVNDLLMLVVAVPFKRFKSKEELDAHMKVMKDKWAFIGSRFEAILLTNDKSFMVGKQLTYADILVAHITTWFVEECGPEIVADMPNLVNLQNMVISLPGVSSFIKSSRYYPLSGEDYIAEVILYFLS
jgi:glutathione S-transferase